MNEGYDDTIHDRHGEVSSVLFRQLGAFEDPAYLKNEIWTQVQEVSVDATDQVEVHRIRGDAYQTLVDLLDEEQYDDAGPEPLFDADAFGELPAGARHEDYELTAEQMQQSEEMAAAVRQNALDVSARLRKEEEILDGESEDSGLVLAGALQEPFIRFQQREREDDPQPEARKGKRRLGELSAADIRAIVECE